MPVLARLHQFGNRPVLGRRDALRPDLQFLARLLHRIVNRENFVNGAAKGLFHVHVLACVQSVNGAGSVPVVRGGDHNRVNVLDFQQLLVVGKRLAVLKFQLVLRPLDAASVQIANSDLRRVVVRRTLVEQANVRGIALRAHADMPDVDAVVCAQNAAHSFCRRGHAAHRYNSCRTHRRVAQKHAPRRLVIILMLTHVVPGSFALNAKQAQRGRSLSTSAALPV